MIAYHFPPLAGSSGIQRTLRFVQHLPAHGWEPLVISADPRAYESTSDDLLAEIPPGTVVRRPFALDTARHLAIRGRYPGFLARPDRWVSWRFAAVREGLRLIREFRPQAIWSTYPIATAHVIGHELARRSGLPWIADFRDPMAQDGYPADPKTWLAFKRIEEAAMREAHRCVFTTPGAARYYRARYSEANERIAVIENGYDEETFVRAERALPTREPLIPGALTLLHSGIVYPVERDPAALLAAFGQIAASGAIPRGRLRLRFRSPVHGQLLERLVTEHGIADLVEILPAIPYEGALAEMLRADGLLVLQAANCNDQIPAKLYEYLRARRPVVALTEPGGDTGAALAAAGVTRSVPLDDIAAIRASLQSFAADPGEGRLPSATAVAAASRAGRAAEFADLLNDATHMTATRSGAAR
jgi:glycosyltransferase involved in cell wall biosynthesis